MSDAVKRAEEFLNRERAFRLGELLTESSHPKTRQLSQTATVDLPGAIRLLQSVDADIPPAMEKVLGQDCYRQLIDAFVEAMQTGKRIFFTGCGATGRLSILLEATWRRFWRTSGYADTEMENRVFSVMAGGDFALIKSVEGYEDFPDFGRRQLREMGVDSGDVVVAITEGGETPFVIGTAWEGLDAGAEVFFVYNNPTELLRRHVERSREMIDEPCITKLDLTTGPMAITGSTRMQATTAELFVVGSALEIALLRFLESVGCAPHTEDPNGVQCPHYWLEPDQYLNLFTRLLKQLTLPEAVDMLTRATEFEEGIYRRKGFVTYTTGSFLLDVLTDTTERSPTFMLPPFRKRGDSLSPRSWAFVKDPFRPTVQAWHSLLQRPPRGLDWGIDVYEELNAPAGLRANPPKLDNSEIYRFMIGNEPDSSRTDAPDSALVAIAAGYEAPGLIKAANESFGGSYKKNAALIVGAREVNVSSYRVFNFLCDVIPSPLQLWHHLAVKLILNTLSTATMVRMDRVIGNAMAWLSPSNKKLIDRGSRLIAQEAGATYEQACIALHEAMDEVETRRQEGEEVPSPVALAVERLSR